MRLALALLAAAASPAAAEWAVSAPTAAVVAAEALVAVAGAPEGVEPDAAASSTPDFAVIGAEDRGGGSWAWTVLPLSTGTVAFTPRFKAKDGSALAAPAASIAVKEPSLAPDAQPFDIKPPRKARPALWPWALAAVLALLGRELWRRRKARPAPGAPEAPQEPALPADEEARRAVAALQAEGLFEKDAAAYYVRLSDILRVYLERRYGEPATAMTTVEAARLVKDREPDLRVSASVRDLLSRADLVKFARARPGGDEGARDAAMVLSVVAATAPRAAPEPAGTGRKP